MLLQLCEYKAIGAGRLVQGTHGGGIVHIECGGPCWSGGSS